MTSKDSLDLAATLRAVGAEEERAADVDAGFFHRTLARWLGLPEGETQVKNPVRWDYGFWKATFEPLTKAYVEVIKTKLPNAKVIWASSTPVTVKDKPADLDTEVNPIIIEQNRMAAKVMAEMQVPVNDFYSLLVDKRTLARGDRFHWTAPAYKLLADLCIESILKALPKP